LFCWGRVETLLPRCSSTSSYYLLLLLLLLLGLLFIAASQPSIMDSNMKTIVLLLFLLPCFLSTTSAALCSTHADCSSCASDSACGFCLETSSCINITDSFSCTDFRGASECQYPACHTYNNQLQTCNNCTTNPKCGYCAASQNCIPEVNRGQCSYYYPDFIGPGEACDACSTVQTCIQCSNYYKKGFSCGFCEASNTCQKSGPNNAAPADCPSQLWWSASARQDICSFKCSLLSERGCGACSQSNGCGFCERSGRCSSDLTDSFSNSTCPIADWQWWNYECTNYGFFYADFDYNDRAATRDLKSSEKFSLAIILILLISLPFVLFWRVYRRVRYNYVENYKNLPVSDAWRSRFQQNRRWKFALRFYLLGCWVLLISALAVNSYSKLERSTKQGDYKVSFGLVTQSNDYFSEYYYPCVNNNDSETNGDNGQVRCNTVKAGVYLTLIYSLLGFMSLSVLLVENTAIRAMTKNNFNRLFPFSWIAILLVELTWVFYFWAAITWLLGADLSLVEYYQNFGKIRLSSSIIIIIVTGFAASPLLFVFYQYKKWLNNHFQHCLRDGSMQQEEGAKNAAPTVHSGLELPQINPFSGSEESRITQKDRSAEPSVSAVSTDAVQLDGEERFEEVGLTGNQKASDE
jgi:hypothetical protein